MFYQDIGVNLSISQNEQIQKNKFLEQNKNCKNIDNNTSISNIILNEEQKAYDIAITAQNLKELEDLFQKFEGCSLKKTAKNFIEFQGYKNSDILVIDGAPNSEEDMAGKSFVSEKGNLFDKILKSIDLKRENIFIVNGVPWRPPGNRYPTEQEINI